MQALLFDPNKLAPTYPESMITRPFPFNAFYDIDEVPEVDASTYRLQVGGLAKGKRVWTLEELRALPQESQMTRHICIEGWSAIGKWGGVRFAEFLKRSGADITAKYVSLHCADNYWTSIDMPTALHAQTLLTLTLRRPGPAAEIRLPDEAAHADQARLQESEAHRRDHRDERLSRWLLGEPGLQLVRRFLMSALVRFAVHRL